MDKPGKPRAVVANTASARFGRGMPWGLRGQGKRVWMITCAEGSASVRACCCPPVCMAWSSPLKGAQESSHEWSAAKLVGKSAFAGPHPGRGEGSFRRPSGTEGNQARSSTTGFAALHPWLLSTTPVGVENIPPPGSPRKPPEAWTPWSHEDWWVTASRRGGIAFRASFSCGCAATRCSRAGVVAAEPEALALVAGRWPARAQLLG